MHSEIPNIYCESSFHLVKYVSVQADKLLDTWGSNKGWKRNIFGEKIVVENMLPSILATKGVADKGKKSESFEKKSFSIICQQFLSLQVEPLKCLNPKGLTDRRIPRTVIRSWIISSDHFISLFFVYVTVFIQQIYLILDLFISLCKHSFAK